ncbi:MAG: DUF1569 domain-containing protein [Granulosicoccaceae bacterium]
MSRRSIIRYLAFGGFIVGAGGSHHWLTRARDNHGLAINLTLERLSKLDISAIENTGSWEVARTFDHLAQSIEFSMIGFPVMKPKVFRSTVGPLAFSVFQARGRMSHGLDEEIPGEIVKIENTSVEAYEGLLKALESFDAHDGPLKPHFAYGALDRDQYAIAHVMHINNHLEEFRGV